MTTIYLIRHAEAEGNLYRLAQGQKNSNLTDRGWRQVRALEKRFADIRVDAVYSSDLYRTCATASAIYKPKGLPLHRVPALREIHVGGWEQRTWGDIYRQDPQQMEAFSRHFTKWHIEGAETPQQVLDRVLGAVRAIAAENEGRTVAVFSHGYAIRVLLAHLEGYSMEEAGQTPHGDNTAVSMLEAEGGTLRVVFRDDNSHLQTPEFLAGEKVRKRANALEPGLWFQPLKLEEQADWFAELVSSVWRDARPFDREKLLADAVHRTTLAGYLGEEPVGLVQVGPEPGWISLACIREDCRKRGFGGQLIGQAVLLARQAGGEKLTVLLGPDSVARDFFADYGFGPVGTSTDGRTVFEKNIAFISEFLGEYGENIDKADMTSI